MEILAGPPLRTGGCAAVVDGRRAVVRHALPGERVRAVVTSDTDMLRLDAVEVLAPSPDRVTPPCPYAVPGGCGGCDWQHASLPAQRAMKADMIRTVLARVAGLDVAGVVEPEVVERVVVEPVPVPGRADDGLAWRSRVQFAVTREGRLGLHKHRSAEVQPVDRCLIASDGVESVGAEALDWPVAERVEVIAGSAAAGPVALAGSGALAGSVGVAGSAGAGPGAVAGSGGDRAVVVTPRRRGARVGAAVDESISVLRGSPRDGATEPVRGRPGVREHAAGRTWWVGGSGFWQSHVAAPSVLVPAVLDALAPEPGDLALDLYAGVGLFAGALGPLVSRVVAVESDPGAVADARQNLRDLPAVEVHEGRVDAALARLGLGRVDLAVLDPPRDGAGAAVMAALCALAPRRVAYVSCDPASLARDLGVAGEHGYALASLRAFDLFPMTSHVECVAVLEPSREPRGTEPVMTT